MYMYKLTIARSIYDTELLIIKSIQYSSMLVIYTFRWPGLGWFSLGLELTNGLNDKPYKLSYIMYSILWNT